MAIASVQYSIHYKDKYKKFNQQNNDKKLPIYG